MYAKLSVGFPKMRVQIGKTVALDIVAAL